MRPTAQRPRDEPPGQPETSIARNAKHRAGRVGSIELLGARKAKFHGVLVPVSLLEVKPVKQPMGKGGDQDSGDSEEGYASIEGEEGGEELARDGCDGIDGAHAAQNHCRVHESVDPRETTKEAIAKDANGEGDTYDSKCEHDVIDDSPDEKGPGEDRLGTVLIVKDPAGASLGHREYVTSIVGA